MRDVLPLPVAPCFLLLVTAWKVSHCSTTVRFQCWMPQISKRWCGAVQRQGPCAFTKHRALLLPLAASLLLSKSLEDNEDNHHSSFSLWIHRSGKLHAGFLRLWEGLNSRLPEVDWMLLLSSECWLLLSLLRQTSWPHQHLDENLILTASSHVSLEDSTSYQAEIQSSALRAAKGSLNQSSFKTFKSKKPMLRAIIERQYL